MRTTTKGGRRVGWVMVTGRCFGCGAVFSFNPHRVPSYDGEPICRSCMTVVNRRRRKAGLDLWPVYEDSYEPIPESEL
jgi:hypothetical protein